MNGACNGKPLFWPRPLGPWGVKRSNIMSQFQRFLYQTLCAFSQMKDTKHIRRDFHFIAWVMPKGWDFGALGCPGGHFFKHGHMAYQIDGDEEQNGMEAKISSLGQTGDLRMRSKGQMSLNLGYHVKF